MGYNVFVTRKIPKCGLDLLEKECEVVEVNPEDKVLKKGELVEKVKGRDGILCLLTDKIDADVIEAAKGAKGFANYAVGYDNIDVKSATKYGMIVTNTPGVLTDATADLSWALLFSVARRIVEADKFVRNKKFESWMPLGFLGTDIKGKTLGIIGAGRIGTAMASRSIGFKMKVIYFDPQDNKTLEKELGAKKVSLDTLLRESDFISLHIPLQDDTYHLISEKEFGIMKPNVILINTSRGSVINEIDLVRALNNKRIAGAGLDVYENEPQLTTGLEKLDNVVLLPHIGSATVETRSKMALMAAENLIKILKGEIPPNLVNPEVLEKLNS